MISVSLLGRIWPLRASRSRLSGWHLALALGQDSAFPGGCFLRLCSSRERRWERAGLFPWLRALHAKKPHGVAFLQSVWGRAPLLHVHVSLVLRGGHGVSSVTMCPVLSVTGGGGKPLPPRTIHHPPSGLELAAVTVIHHPKQRHRDGPAGDGMTQTPPAAPLAAQLTGGAAATAPAAIHPQQGRGAEAGPLQHAAPSGGTTPIQTTDSGRAGVGVQHCGRLVSQGACLDNSNEARPPADASQCNSDLTV